MPRQTAYPEKRARSPEPLRRSKRARCSRVELDFGDCVPNDGTSSDYQESISSDHTSTNSGVVDSDDDSIFSGSSKNNDISGHTEITLTLEEDPRSDKGETDDEEEEVVGADYEEVEEEDSDLEDGCFDLNDINWDDDSEPTDSGSSEEIALRSDMRRYLSYFQRKASRQILNPEAPKFMSPGIARLLDVNSTDVLVDRAMKGIRLQDYHVLGAKELAHNRLLELSAEETGRFGIYVNVVLDETLNKGYELYVGSACGTGGLTGLKAGLSGRWRDHRTIIGKGLEKLMEPKFDRNGKVKASHIAQHYRIAAAKGATSNFRILASWPRLINPKSAKTFIPFALLMEGIFMYILGTCQSVSISEEPIFDRLLPIYREKVDGQYPHQGLNRAFPLCASTRSSAKSRQDIYDFLLEFMPPAVKANHGRCEQKIVDEASRQLAMMDLIFAPTTIYQWWHSKYLKENEFEKEYQWTEEEETALRNLKVKGVTWENIATKMAELGFHRSMTAYKHRWSRNPMKSNMHSNRSEEAERKKIATLAIFEQLWSKSPNSTETSMLEKTAIELNKYGFEMRSHHVRQIVRKKPKAEAKSGEFVAKRWSNAELETLRTIYEEQEMTKDNWSAKELRKLLLKQGINRTLDAVKQRVSAGMEPATEKAGWGAEEDDFLISLAKEAKDKSTASKGKKKTLGKADWEAVLQKHIAEGYDTRNLRSIQRRTTWLKE